MSHNSDSHRWVDNVSGLKIPASKYACLPKECREPRTFPRLSRPVPMIRSEYDVVVVGSGYGAGVAASRMARAGKRVAVLELGEEKWPGEYPSSLKEATPELHVSGNAGRDGKKLIDVEIGKKTGLYHLVLGEGQNVFVGNGLGGTSLLNANVFLRADHRTLQLSAWPPEIRKNEGSLDSYYDRAAQMLTPTPYPDSYPPLKKLKVLEKQAKIIGQQQNFYKVPQTTFFHDGPNSAGVEMKASTGSGQDCTGVNDGSKNSVLVTYLADAWNWGAEIFCECEVRHVQEASNGKGYIVCFVWHGKGTGMGRNEKSERLMWVRAREFCILGAGALGTTSILLRSQKRGLDASSFLGQKLSGNGDILNFAYNTNEIVNGIGTETPDPSNPPGPTITGIIDARNPTTSPNVLDGYVIEEGAIPASLAPLIQDVLEAMPGKALPKFGQYNALRHFLSRTKSRIFGPYVIGGSVNRTQTYLIMSHDSNEAILTLAGDKTYLQFTGVGRTERVSEMRKVLALASGSVGGTLIDEPFYVENKEQITVHPLGGAVMSFDGTGRHGAVDHMGRLFLGEGSDVHHGIVCVDAAVIPTALGVNPFATITALAERTCDIIIRQNDWKVDESNNGILNLFSEPKISHSISPYLPNYDGTKVDSAGVRFTEVMEGYIHIGTNITDFEVAHNVAEEASSSASLYITVDTFNLDNLTSISDNASIATGTFSCGALSQLPLMVLHGQVQFFTTDSQISDGTNLVYNLTLLSAEGETYLLQGYKKVDSTMAFSASQTWKATTTLYTTISRVDGALVGRGIIRISWRNFVSELKTFGTTIHAKGLLGMIHAPFRFLKHFAKKTTEYFLSPFRPLQFPDKSTIGYFPKAAPRKTVNLVAKDGVQTVMKVWHPGPGGKRHEMPILFVPGASVDDQVFSLPTIQTNTVDYFTGLGYTCYVPTLRFGIAPAAQEGYTAYDARYDVKAAMEFVRQEEGHKKIYIVCHCLGSIATNMALLTGTIDASWIKGMTVSQVSMNLRFGRINKIKSRTQALEVVYKIFAGPWFPTDSTPASPFFQRLIDQFLRLYPVGTCGEICNSTVCHRGSLVFSRLWTHTNLNHATHNHLSSFFGGIHMNFLSHLTRMGSTSPYHLRSNLPEFEDLVEQPGNLGRLKGLKIQFLSGGANVVFDPWSTSESYDLLRHEFGTDDYERVVVAGYGHLDTWMGKHSYKDVFPRVRGHVEMCEGQLGGEPS